MTVDARHKLILDHEVTNDPTDRGHLSAMAIRAKDLLGVRRLQAVADMGYYDGEEVKACAEAGIKTYLPKPITSANRPLGLFAKEDFRYDARRDCYRCPAGQRPAFRPERQPRRALVLILLFHGWNPRPRRCFRPASVSAS